jgi:hypothetical protein
VFSRASRQSREGHFEQLWNQLVALHESKLLGSRSGRNNRIKKAVHPIPLQEQDGDSSVTTERASGRCWTTVQWSTVIFLDSLLANRQSQRCRQIAGVIFATIGLEAIRCRSRDAVF